jgi:CheY-like chemotaxis protein
MSNVQVETRALLVSRDDQAIETLCHCAQQIGAHVEICPDAKSAIRKLCRSKFEAVILDLAGDPPALQLITKMHGMTSYTKAVVFAICDGAEQRKAAFENGATLILDKGSPPGAVLRTFRAAYPMMVAERRRCFRYPVEAAIFITRPGSRPVQAKTINVSEAGMAVCCPEALKSGEQVELRLRVPGTTEDLTLSAQVCWANSEGLAGVKFLSLLNSAAQQLQNWLSARFEECTPPLSGRDL